MNPFDREEEESDEQDLVAAALEARLAHIESLMHDLHDWMRTEQVAALPEPYRRLYSHLIAGDLERRYAAQLIRSIFHQSGTSEAGPKELNSRAAAAIDDSITRLPESLPTIPKAAGGARPFVLALVGPSGAGKTTLMYKLAVRAVLTYGLRVKIVSSDTYKIGSVEGVQTIADILSVPFGIAFEPSEMAGLIDGSEADFVILDTAGRSDRTSREELSAFVSAARPDQTHLVLSATMSQRALQEIAALFLGERIDCVTFTKLDEAPSLGGMVSAIQWMSIPLGYVSGGTTIPDDLLPSTDVPLGQWTLEGMPLPEHDPEAKHV